MGGRLCVLGALAVAALALGCAALGATPAGRYYIQSVTLTPKGSPHGEGGASGAVTICLNPSQNAVAYNFTALTLADAPKKGQIRQGSAGSAVVTFGAPGMIDPTVGEVEWNDSTTANASAMSQLASKPGGYFVVVTTRAYPNGALRGKLGGWKKVATDSDAASECAFS
jgi:hypothetical protein